MIKLQPEMFRRNTVFLLNEGSLLDDKEHSERTFTADKVIRNGINSYVIQTTTPCDPAFFPPSMRKTFNIEHVQEILKAGTGPLVIQHDPYEGFVERLYEDMQRYQNELGPFARFSERRKSSRKYYQILSTDMLVTHLIAKYLPAAHHVFDTQACKQALMEQSFMHTHRQGKFFTTHYAPKKRVDAWFKANRNRFLTNLKAADEEEREQMAKDSAEDFDRTMDEIDYGINRLDRQLERAHEDDYPAVQDHEEGYRRDDQAAREAEQALRQTMETVERLSADARAEVESLKPKDVVYGGATGPSYRYSQQGDGFRCEVAPFSEAATSNEHIPIEGHLSYTGKHLPQEGPGPYVAGVRVKFQMTEDIWNKVVVEGLENKEGIYVEEESTMDFIAEYPSREDFNKAISRFEGLIEYEELKE